MDRRSRAVNGRFVRPCRRAFLALAIALLAALCWPAGICATNRDHRAGWQTGTDDRRTGQGHGSQWRARCRRSQPGGPPGARPARPGGKARRQRQKERRRRRARKRKSDSDRQAAREAARVPDPREFEVKLDDKGRVPPFNFIGQPWPDVMQWLANISKCSLDWQELPNDYLNLTTQRPYPARRGSRSNQPPPASSRLHLDPVGRRAQRLQDREDRSRASCGA